MIKYSISENNNYSRQIINNNLNKWKLNQDISINSQDSVVNVTKNGNYFAGYNVFQLQNFSDTLFRKDIDYRITDMNGTVIKQLNVGAPFEANIIPINSTTFLITVSEGKIYFWNIYTDNVVKYDIIAHHDVAYNPITKTFMILTKTDAFYNGNQYLFDTLVEYNMKGKEVWRLNTIDFISPDKWNQFESVQGIADITHANTIFWDIDEDVVYINFRNLNTFYKIDYKTKKVIWSLGEFGDIELYDIHGNRKNNLFYHAHALEKYSKDSFILFDNDYYNQTNIENKISRVIKIRVDEQIKKAYEIWSWKAPKSYFSNIWGDADPLPNNNILADFGAHIHPDSNIGARLVEINKAGDIVWQMNYPNTDSNQYGIYGVERIRFSPIINSSVNNNYLNTKNIVLDYDVRYNFQTSYFMNGSYELYLNGTKIKTSQFQFDKYWRATDLNIDIGKLNIGKYNVTLVVLDEGGHKSISTSLISVTSLYINQENENIYEKNDPDALIVWTGDTSSPLTRLIYINETLISNDTWTGGLFSIDLNNFDSGNLNIWLKLINNTNIIYNSNSIITLLDNYPPEISVINLNEQYQWNDPIQFVLNIRDNSSVNWKIELNNQIIDTNSILDNDFSKNINLDGLNEGIYELIISAIDKTSLQSTYTKEIIILPPNIPVIISELSSEYTWVTNNTIFQWQVHGGMNYEIYRNDTLIAQGEITNKFTINYQINDWRREGWILATYNITIMVKNQNSQDSNSSIIIVQIPRSDPYANEVIDSQTYLTHDPKNIIGKPDNEYTTVFFDYGQGYITVDMGQNELIENKFGSDVIIHAKGGFYEVLATNDLSKPFQMITRGQNTIYIDLSSTGFSQIRYIKIAYYSGEFVEVDAIEAIHYDEQGSNIKLPLINGTQKVVVEINQIAVSLQWSIEDRYPYRYEIYLNSTKVISEFLDQELISYEVQLPNSFKFYSVRLDVFDIFGNSSQFNSIIRLSVDDMAHKQNQNYTTILLSVAVLILIIIKFRTKLIGLIKSKN